MLALAAVANLDARIGGGHAGTALFILVLAAGGVFLLTAGCRFLRDCRETHEARYTSPRR